MQPRGVQTQTRFSIQLANSSSLSQFNRMPRPTLLVSAKYSNAVHSIYCTVSCIKSSSVPIYALFDATQFELYYEFHTNEVVVLSCIIHDAVFLLMMTYVRLGSEINLF